MRVLSFFVAALAALAGLMLPGAEARAQLLRPGGNAIETTLLAEEGHAAPGGTLTLAIVMQPKAGWHGYWQNPGDAGTEMRIGWTLPAGAVAGRPRYPVPETLIISGLMNHVYESEYVLLIDVKLPNTLPAGALPIRAKLDYLACTDQICVPEQSEVAVELPVRSMPPQPIRQAQFDRYRMRLPKPLASVARFELKNGRLRMAIPFPEGLPASDLHFFSATSGVLDYAQVQTFGEAEQKDLLLFEAPAPAGARVPQAIKGVLKLAEHEGLAIVAAPGPVPPLPNPAKFHAGAAEGLGAVALALAGAVLGGILLNIMPCVFPILSLKALSLAKVGGNEAAARREAIAYASGAILICLALGALLLILRAGGAAIGWAFQLQDPRVIAFLLLLVTVIALNLAGLFELPSFGRGQRLTGKEGVGGAFWTGALAAFVATPCTGPFMGAALGAALVLPAPAALAVFAGLGLGLASPFLLIGFVPPIRRRLPRPGPWMSRFRRWMSLPMFLTALALAWVLGRQAGANGMALGIGAALIVALALWWMGRRQGEGKAWLPLATAAIAAAAAIILVPTATAPASAQPKGRLGAEQFSEARLAEFRAQRRPVFVYFTADWCVTCKVNERATLRRDEVAAAFAERNVKVLVGDWTRGDAAIGRFLEKHGRTGVPLYLYYAPGKPVEILPQVLTVPRLTSLAG